MSQQFPTRSQDRQVKRKEITPGLFLQPFVVSQLVGSVVAQIVEGSGLTGTDFAVISSLAIWEASTPTELAHLLGMSPTTLSAVVKRLEERGLVSRSRDREDGRRYIVQLTAKGKRARAKALE